MKTDHDVSSKVYVVGDMFARQGRDSMGLSVRLYRSLRGYRETPVPILDLTTKGSLTRTVRSVVEAQVEPGSVVVCVVGAADAKGGGPPPSSFVSTVSLLITIIAGEGARPVIVLAPPCPTDAGGKLKGYAKGSRRWLRRVAAPLREECEKASVSFLVPELPDHVWGDQLSLKPDGVQALVEQITSVIVHQPATLA